MRAPVPHPHLARKLLERHRLGRSGFALRAPGASAHAPGRDQTKGRDEQASQRIVGARPAVTGMTRGPIAAAKAALAADKARGDKAIWITRVPDADFIARAHALEAEGPGNRPLW